MSIQGYAVPFFKGPVNESDADSLSLVTKQTGVGSVISDETYLQFLEDRKLESPTLVQAILRAVGSALHVIQEQKQQRILQLLCVEGCQHTIGGQPMTGAGIVRSVWKNVVPADLLSDLPEPQIREVAACTVAEAREAVRPSEGVGSAVHGVTDGYHANRVHRTLREEAGDGPEIVVVTPEEVVRDVREPQPGEQFLVDLIKRGAIDPRIEAFERNREKLRTVFHTLSRRIETYTGFSPEIWLANRLRRASTPSSQSA